MVYESYNVPYSEDELNINHLRNIKNTDKNYYNCGGYALGTFSWYCPNMEWNDPWGWNNGWSINTMKKVTEMCVNQMLSDFYDLRKISSVSEIGNDEYGIAFRVSNDGDFHYVKRSKNGHWYHKRGWLPTIETMTVKEVFSKEWCYRYDGPIILFAKKV